MGRAACRSPVVLRLFVVVAVALALARPQTPQKDDDLELEGIDIVVTLDLSGSMEETDLQPNRLEAAKAVIQDFVTRRRGDRIGLVIFGREAYTYTPLTLDHGTFLRMLAELQPGIVDGRGTAIGNGLGWRCPVCASPTPSPRSSSCSPTGTTTRATSRRCRPPVSRRKWA